MDPDAEPADGHLVAVERVAQPAWVGGLVEAERREERPDPAPGAGEEAGLGGGAGAELEEDEDEDVDGESAKPVLACGGGGIVGGEPRALGGALAAAAQLHRVWGRDGGSRSQSLRR